MTLGSYLKDRNIYPTDFAALVGAHKSTISRVLKGQGCSRKLALRIESATAGAVTLDDVMRSQTASDRTGGRAA